MSYGWDKKPKERSSFKGSGDKGDLFFTMKKSGKYQIRFVGEPRFYKSLYVAGKGYFTVPESYVERLEAIDLKVDDMVAYNVIDRQDQEARKAEGKGTRFKVFAKKTSVFKPVIANFEETQVNPGGQQGQDWRIIAEIPAAVENRRNTKYTFVTLKNTPFTDEEKSLLRRADRFGKNVKEEFKELPIGEKGLIDLDILYGDEKAAKKLDEFFSEIAKTPSSATTDDEDDTFSEPVAEKAPAEPVKKEAAASTDDTDFDNLF